MEKRRKIFDDGAAMVEEVAVVKAKKKPELNVDVDSPATARTIVNKFVKVADVVDTLAGYLPTQVNFMPKDGGNCLLCGKETTSSMRKICFECLQKKGQELYRKTKTAIEMGDKEFQI